MENKKCAKCKIELPLEMFNTRLIAGKYRPFSYCKPCERLINNTRHNHKCVDCGKEYTSGNKDSKLCNKCYHKIVGLNGRNNLIKKNANQYGKNNHMYGVHRYGKENPNYNPVKTDEERESQRCLQGYEQWRDSVYERDKYTCQCCGYDKGHTLNAHHLDGYNWCVEKRTDVSNGITLCKDCHISFHKMFGNKNNTKEQFYEFINMLIPR